MITSHIGTNPETQRQMLAGEIEVELVPQGTLAERIRAGGYGLGGVLTPTGVGHAGRGGQAGIEIDGRMFLLERPLKADFALLYAKQADYIGNLDVCADGAKLQSADGDGRRCRHRRGREHRAGRRDPARRTS